MGIFSGKMPTDVCGSTLYQSEKCYSAEQCGFFLRKKPLSDRGFGVQQLWNRCGREDRFFSPHAERPVAQSKPHVSQ